MGECNILNMGASGRWMVESCRFSLPAAGERARPLPPNPSPAVRGFSIIVIIGTLMSSQLSIVHIKIRFIVNHHQLSHGESPV